MNYQNPINYCMQRIKNEIPREILIIAATEENFGYNQNVTLEEKIMARVIKARLLLDVEIMSTISRQISLKNCTVTGYKTLDSQFEYLVEVPDSVLDGKEIVSASFIFYNMIMPQMGMLGGSALENSMSTLMQAHSSLDLLTTNRLDVVGKNIVLVNTGSIHWTFLNSSMEVNLSPNPNMSHVKGTAIIELGDLAVLCAKQWIYNTLIIQIDQGYIRGGHNIDAVKNMIDRYESAIDVYKEKLETWNKIGFMLDARQYQKFIDMQMGY